MTDGKAPPGRPPERVRLMVRKRRQYGGFIDEDMLWPKGWPIPEPGQVVAAGVLKGFVEYVEFDVDAQRVLVYLR